MAGALDDGDNDDNDDDRDRHADDDPHLLGEERVANIVSLGISTESW